MRRLPVIFLTFMFFGSGFLGGFFGIAGAGGGSPSLDFSVNTNSMYIPLF